MRIDAVLRVKDCWLISYPFLCAFLAWLCWDEFLDSEVCYISMKYDFGSGALLTGHCDG